MEPIRNLKRSAKVFAKAFADTYFHENEELFAARFTDEFREMLWAVAMKQREKRRDEWRRSEQVMQGQVDE